MKKFAAKIAIIVLILSACERSSQFPPEPILAWREFTLVPASEDPDMPIDHLNAFFEFTDGDGDIGLNPGDLSPPHCEGCDHYFNLFVYVFSKEDGVFDTTYSYHSRIENLTPEAQNKTLEGTMTYKIDVANRTSDTIKVDIYIEDRALNKSNTITTDELYVDL